MCGTKTTIGVGRTVGFSLDQVFPVKVEFDVVGGAVECHHHVLDLTGLSVTNTGGGHGLEPVAVGVGAAVDGPVCLMDGFREWGKRRAMFC